MDARTDEARPKPSEPAPARCDDRKAARDRETTSEAQSTSRPGLIAALRRRPWVTAAVLIAVIAIAVIALMWWLEARHFETTDDAFIDARTVAVSPRVSGTIASLAVSDNAHVKKDAVLARIDPVGYQAKLAQAKAQVAEAAANIGNLDAQIGSQMSRIEQAQKQVTEAKAALEFAQQEYARYSDLVKTGAGTQQRAQQASADLTQKQASFGGATLAETVAQKQLVVLQSQRKAAEAQLAAAQAGERLAEIDVSYTEILAPADGRVAKLSGAPGTFLQPGQSILMFVPDDFWVTANFKETQLADMHPGQQVDIAIDAYPGRTFRGHVDSIQSGSGSAFSLLPAENATGNYIKVVQRVPVKIAFDADPGVLLGPGMSVVPSVRVK